MQQQRYAKQVTQNSMPSTLLKMFLFFSSSKAQKFEVALDTLGKWTMILTEDPLIHCLSARINHWS